MLFDENLSCETTSIGRIYKLGQGVMPPCLLLFVDVHLSKGTTNRDDGALE